MQTVYLQYVYEKYWAFIPLVRILFSHINISLKYFYWFPFYDKALMDYMRTKWKIHIDELTENYQVIELV